MKTWIDDLLEIGKNQEDYIGQIYESLVNVDPAKRTPGYIAVCFKNALKNDCKRLNKQTGIDVLEDREDVSELNLNGIESKITDEDDLKMLDDYFECKTWIKLAHKWKCSDKTAKTKLVNMLKKYV